MNEQLSRINNVFEDLGEVITKSDSFNKIPIKWAMFEITPNNMPPTVIVFEALPFRVNGSFECEYERQLDIIIIHNTNNEREINKRLSKYAEDMVELLHEYMMSLSKYQLEFLQGSEIRAKRNNREDTESYKGSKTLYSSLIVLSYLVRY